MGKLSGILKIEGALDELTFYRTQDGHLVRRKGGVSGNRIARDAGYARTRENGREFGNAGKLLRDAVRLLMVNASDSRVTSRLMQVMTWIKEYDRSSVRGSVQWERGLLIL